MRAEHCNSSEHCCTGGPVSAEQAVDAQENAMHAPGQVDVLSEQSTRNCPRARPAGYSARWRQVPSVACETLSPRHARSRASARNSCGTAEESSAPPAGSMTVSRANPWSARVTARGWPPVPIPIARWTLASFSRAAAFFRQPSACVPSPAAVSQRYSDLLASLSFLAGAAFVQYDERVRSGGNPVTNRRIPHV
jgi:hypothetical protein